MIITAVGKDRYGNEIGVLNFTWTTTIGSVRPSPDGRTAMFLAGDASGSGTITIASGGKSLAIPVSVSPTSSPIGQGLRDPLSLLLLAVAVLAGAISVFIFSRYRQLKRRNLEAKGNPSEEQKEMTIQETRKASRV